MTAAAGSAAAPAAALALAPTLAPTLAGGRVPGLAPYLHGLWQLRPHTAALAALPRPVWQREPLALTLPAGAALALQHAAAAHAAAHGCHGGAPMARAGLKPVQQVLLGVLEDARVEWLALQGLPGLRRLWLPWHDAAGADSGTGFEALLQRLARTLLDPTHIDPHPWVHNVRAMFYADADGRRLALQGATAVRRVASLLGHDIGQMRQPFNARTYLVAPAYRDDNQHLWLATDPGAAAPPPEAGTDSGPAAPAAAPPPPAAPQAPVAVYPEWDRLIGRHRAAWCQVFEDAPVEMPPTDALARAAPWQAWLQAHAGLVQRSGRRLAQAGIGRAPGRPQAAQDGEALHLPALVDARVAQRRRQPLPLRPYQQRPRLPQPLAVQLLLDTSASTARPVASAGGTTVLRGILEAGLVAAQALSQAGHEVAVHGFASNTRHEVRLRPLKRHGEALDDALVLARVDAVRAGGSTRLGAALRHAAARLALRREATQRLVLIVTDGEPHDIDVHDPRYLLADLGRAVREARQGGIAVACLNLDPARTPALRAALGGNLGGNPGGTAACQDLADLSQLPQRLEACAIAAGASA